MVSRYHCESGESACPIVIVYVDGFLNLLIWSNEVVSRCNKFGLVLEYSNYRSHQIRSLDSVSSMRAISRRWRGTDGAKYRNGLSDIVGSHEKVMRPEEAEHEGRVVDLAPRLCH